MNTNDLSQYDIGIGIGTMAGEPRGQYVTIRVDFYMKMYARDTESARRVLQHDLDEAVKKMLHTVDAVRVTGYKIRGNTSEVGPEVTTDYKPTYRNG